MGNNLKKLREQAGLTQPKAAAAMGLSLGGYKKLEGGERRLNLDYISRAARAFGVSEAAVIEAHVGNPDGGPLLGAPGEVVNTDGEKIVLPDGSIGEVDTRAGLGAGQYVPDAYEATEEGWRIVDAMKPEPWILPPSFVRNGFRAPLSKIVAITTQGESMAPTINHGDVVFIDTTHQRISPPGLYAMRDIYGEIIVKRLEAFREKGEAMVRIESDNPSHGPRLERIADIHVVGRICGMMKLV